MLTFWKILSSRKLAVYLLCTFIALLIISSFLPSEMTVTLEKWNEIKSQKPTTYWLATRFSTPYIVRHPATIVLSIFLFLSTFACTWTRVSFWIRTRDPEFEKGQAFSFSEEEDLSEGAEAVSGKITELLEKGKWDYTVSDGPEGYLIEAQKGMNTGFWGSIIFHMGLIVCFIAIPVTAATVFRGQMLLTRGETVSAREAFISTEGKGAESFPDVPVTVLELEGKYAKGVYKLDFGGKLAIDNGVFPFSVNRPVEYKGFELILHEYGYSPALVIEESGVPLFDYFLNLRSPSAGDYFEFQAKDLMIFALLFPDFQQDGNLLSSKSKDPDNPVLLVRFLDRDGGNEVAKGLIRPGETKRIGEFDVSFPELRNWANFVVVREWGVPIMALGLLIGVPGLFLRFMSNERRFEARITEAGSGSRISLNGYSKYYPAFLEREITHMAEELKSTGREVS